MRKGIINIFATTGISLVLLSIIAMCYSAELICVTTVFQVFLVNIVAHLILIYLSKTEIKYLSVEIVIEIGLIIILSLFFGAIFHWYTSTPIIVLIPMSITIYVISIVLNILRMKQDADEINKLIQINKQDRKNVSVKG